MVNNLFLKRSAIFTFIGVLIGTCCFGQKISVSYNSPNCFPVNTTISPLNPTIKDGTAVSYSVKPQLPEGLKMDPKSGSITGTPKNEAKETEYSIVAISATDTSKSFPIKITICTVSTAANPCPTKTDATTDCCKVNSNHPLGKGEWFLVIMPILLFIIFLILFLAYVNKASAGKFSLKLALSESSYPQITTTNAQYSGLSNAQIVALQNASMLPNAPVNSINFIPPTITITDNKYRPSMSRLIAFLTSVLSLIVGLGLSCFFIYWYLRTVCVADLSKLTTVLLTMGIGVVPYAFNKVASMSGNTPGK